MTDQLIAVAGALIFLAASGYVGFRLGRQYRSSCSRGRFWIASVVSVLLGIGVIFTGLVAGISFISGGGVGLMTGALNGLRWGMGRLSDLPRTPEAAAKVPACESHPDDGHRAHPAT